MRQASEQIARQFANANYNKNTWGSIIVNVKVYGAKGDGLADDTEFIQKAIDSVKETGGTVYFPNGTYRTSRPINFYSNIRLLGDGLTNTYIKPLDNAVIPTNQGVVQTADFLPDRNVWNYYPPYPIGLHMGVGVQDLCIDGNRENQTTGNGLCIYGGKWILQNVAVINTAEHGIWTECGQPNNSTMGDDLHDYLNMHESRADTIYLANNNKHGWYYRGPNDTHIDKVQVKMAGWAAFYQEYGSTIQAGGLKIGSMHAYYCGCEHEADGYMIQLTSAMCLNLYPDSSRKGGIKIPSGSDSVQIAQIYSFKNNQDNAGDFWTLKIDSPHCMIGQLRDVQGVERTWGQNGGVIWITPNAQRTIIGEVRATGTSIPSTIPCVGAKIEGRGTEISDLSITMFGMNAPGSVGLILSARNCSIRGSLINCLLGVDYKNSGEPQNYLSLNLQDCITDITTQEPIATTDTVNIVSTRGYSWTNTGIADIYHLRYKMRIITPAPVLNLVASDGTFLFIEGINTHMTINPPTGAQTGDELTFYFNQDGTGGWNITFDNIFKHNYSNTGNGPWKRYTITFMYNGAYWIQKGAGSGWY